MKLATLNLLNLLASKVRLFKLVLILFLVGDVCYLSCYRVFVKDFTLHGVLIEKLTHLESCVLPYTIHPALGVKETLMLETS